MALDRNAFVANYLDEVKEQLATVDASILSLKEDPEWADPLATLLRALHTIKGSSRMLKFRTMESLAHGLEGVFKGVKEGRYGITREIVRLVLLTSGAMGRSAKAIEEGQSGDADTQAFLAVFELAAASEPFSLDGIAAEGIAADRIVSRPGVPEAATPAPERAAPEAAGLRKPDKARESIRIDLGRVDSIVRILNNLIMKQFQFRKEKELVAKLEEKLASAAAVRSAASASVVEAVRMTRQLRKTMDEDLELMERETFELQGEILSLRMLPLETALGFIGRMVEETSAALGKEIRVSMSGTDLHLDKFILEGLHDPILHLVRNAVDHGIETPAERVAKGKDPAGRLDIRCAAENGHIVIRIKDDGRGLDYGRIRSRAMEMYPAQADEIRDMSEARLNSYLFLSGFSTKSEVTDLSGRGVGLDIVRHNIEGIKGTIGLSSVHDAGTEFSLSLPLSLATIDGFFVLSAGEKFLFPADFVREVIIVKKAEVMDILNRRGFVFRNQVLPLYPLSTILGKGGDDPFEREKLQVVVVEVDGETAGIIVDAIVQYTTLIHKPVPANLRGLRVLQGIVFDENFDIITILSMPELMNRFKRIRNIDTMHRYSSSKRGNKRILVVDDSQTTRDIEKSILELEDYQVWTAVDGIDALEHLREQRFHLVVTDIAMPRMDGLTFIENMRKLDGYGQTPVIVVTSEADQGRRKAFTEAGASAFLIKSDFERENLVERVKALIG